MKRNLIWCLAALLSFGLAGCKKVESSQQPVAPQVEPAADAQPKDIPTDAIKLDNGIAYKIVKTDPNARKLNGNDFVTIEYAGWTQADGKRFYSSAESEPTNGFINEFPYWKSVLLNAHEGDVVQMWLPEELGKKHIIKGKKLNGALIFELTVVKSIVMPKTPEDVAAPPADAIKTASGLASKVLQPGTGTEHPAADSIVRINYSGWTTDGNIFDSSIPRGQAAEFPLDDDDDVIAGWTEGIQLMVVGEKRRFWIPEELAYEGEEGKPQGMLVFDVELLDFRAVEHDVIRKPVSMIIDTVYVDDPDPATTESLESEVPQGEVDMEKIRADTIRLEAELAEIEQALEDLETNKKETVTEPQTNKK